MKENKTDSRFGKVKKSVNQVFQAMPTGKKFNGWELKNLCVDLYPELANAYVDTFLREMRRSFHLQYVLISRSESLYQKIGGTSETTIISSKREREFENYRNLKQQSFDFGEV